MSEEEILEESDLELDNDGVEEDDELGQSPRMTEEQIEEFQARVLSMSPVCRSQFQSAMQNQDYDLLSEECQNQAQEAFNGEVKPPFAGAVPSGEDPTFYIFSFLFLIFLFLALKVYNVSQDLKKLPVKPNKKLSKKKQLKQQMKDRKTE